MKKQTALRPFDAIRDPFALLRRVTSEMDRMFGEAQGPSLRTEGQIRTASWFPELDVFERDQRLVTKVDLPGMKKEDVKVEVTDGHLTISGERKTGLEEKKDQYYRSEREYGSFCRTVALPEGVKLEDVKATFADGVLEVSIPLPVRVEEKVRTVEIEEAPKAARTAA
jgi:HSP20 family protein